MRFHRKKEEAEEIPEVKPKKVKEENDYEWDKKRVSIALIVLAIGFISFMEVKDRFFPNSAVLGTSAVNRSTETVQRVSPPRINVEADVNSKLDQIKQNVAGLNADDVASSSPQIQKVLNDIQGIKDLPANQAKEACQKICQGI